MTAATIRRVGSGLFFVYGADGNRVGYMAGHKGAWEAMTEAGRKLSRPYRTQRDAAEALTQANSRNL